MADLFASSPVSAQDMLGCARRELTMRQKVYPRWVALGKMKDEDAQRETRVMAAIVDHFEKVVSGGA
jgi:hypothetical protein